MSLAYASFPGSARAGRRPVRPCCSPGPAGGPSGCSPGPVFRVELILSCVYVVAHWGWVPVRAIAVPARIFLGGVAVGLAWKGRVIPSPRARGAFSHAAARAVALGRR